MIQRILLTPRQVKRLEDLLKAYRIFRDTKETMCFRAGQDSARWGHLKKSYLVELYLDLPDS